MKTEEKIPQNTVILFVCEHGAAKSIIAAAYFNELARARNLRLHAIARGTNPDVELSPKTVTGLQADGLAPTQSIPIQLTTDDTISARRIISFCDLPKKYQQKTIVEQWDAIPPVDEDYPTSRDAIVERIHRLIDHL